MTDDLNALNRCFGIISGPVYMNIQPRVFASQARYRPRGLARIVFLVGLMFRDRRIRWAPRMASMQYPSSRSGRWDVLRSTMKNAMLFCRSKPEEIGVGEGISELKVLRFALGALGKLSVR